MLPILLTEAIGIGSVRSNSGTSKSYCWYSLKINHVVYGKNKIKNAWSCWRVLGFNIKGSIPMDEILFNFNSVCNSVLSEYKISMNSTSSSINAEALSINNAPLWAFKWKFYCAFTHQSRRDQNVENFRAAAMFWNC